jgi:hypothetical protein
MPSFTHSGGELVMSYTNGTDTHIVRVDVIPFGSTDFLYTGSPYKTSVTETGIADTFDRFGLVWQLYFDPTWTLTLESVWQRSGDTSSMLPGLPVTVPVTGAGPILAIPKPTLRRIFTYKTAFGPYQRLWLSDIATNEIATAVNVSPTSGGFDSRDRAMMNYLSSPATAIVVFNGYPIEPLAKVRIHFAIPSGGGGATTTTGGSFDGHLDVDCLTYPHLATICNTESGDVIISTPSGIFVFDATGITLPGGHRLESF